MQGSPLPVLITLFGELELTNALHLRLFRRELRPAETQTAHRTFRGDLQSGVFTMKTLPEAVYLQAIRLAERWTRKIGTRTLDIIHVASALALQADTFLTFDDRQSKLARAVGLKMG
jgi:hypothetical protein